MSKVAGFIVLAFCINLQIARTAILFDNPLINNPFVRGAKDITNSLKEGGEHIISNLGNNALKLGERIVPFDLSDKLDKLKNQGEGILSGGHNTSACNKLYEEIFSTMSHMASTFYSCVLNTTKFVSSDVQTLTDSAKKLQTNLAQDFHNLSQCFKHPANLTECATKAGQDISRLLPDLEHLITASYDIFKILPEVRTCYVTSHFKYGEKSFNNILSDVLQCFESVI